MKYLGLDVCNCVKDLAERKISYDEVFLIIGNTCFSKKNINSLIDLYIDTNRWNLRDRTEYFHWLNILVSTGQILQPKREEYRDVWPSQVGKVPDIISEKTYHWWLPLVTNPLDLSPAAKEAWDNFLLIDKLSK